MRSVTSNTPVVLVTPAAITAAAAPDVMVTPPAMIEQPGHNNAPVGSQNRADDATGGSGHSVSCMPAVVGGVSSLAKLDDSR